MLFFLQVFLDQTQGHCLPHGDDEEPIGAVRSVSTLPHKNHINYVNDVKMSYFLLTRCRKVLNLQRCGTGISSGAVSMLDEDCDITVREEEGGKDSRKEVENVLKFEIQMYKVRDEEYTFDFQVSPLHRSPVSGGCPLLYQVVYCTISLT